MSNIRCSQCNNEFDDQFEICPHCGFARNTEEKDIYLRQGTILRDRYVIEGVIGSGGFGVTYMAMDRVLNQKVAIKEYFPTDFASRLPGSDEVCAFDGTKGMQFEAGLQCFVDEALRLVSLNHLDGIVRVFDSFIGNCTAYIIMEYVEGVTAMNLLKANGPLPFGEVLDITLPVLYSLEEVHKNGVIHRDIAPDNIVITSDKKIKLIDFGSARSAINAQSNDMDIVLKPGYAPVEQYSTSGLQGSWTDVYAMAAVMYHMITGKLPPESVKRKEEDTLKTPTEMGFSIPADIESAIMKALTIEPGERTKTAKEFADELALAKSKIKPEKKRLKLSKKAIVAIIAAAVVSLAAVVLISLYSFDYKEITPDKSITMPNLEGLSLAQIGAKLKASGIQTEVVKEYSLNGGLKENTVMKQDPEAGTKAVSFDVVRVVLSRNTFTMPDVKNMKKSKAELTLISAGFQGTNYIEYKNKITKKVKEGRVVDTSIKAGTLVRLGQKVTVYLAKKPPKPKPTQPPATQPPSTSSKSSDSGGSSVNSSKKASKKKTSKKKTEEYDDDDDDDYYDDGENNENYDVAY